MTRRLVDLSHPVSRTFAVIKPDVVLARRVGEVISFVEQHAFGLATVVQARPSRGAWEVFYQEHASRPFYDGLCEFMASGPSVLLVLESPDAVSRWRGLMGATDPRASRKGTARYYFGDKRPGAPLWRNAVHGSATDADYEREARFFLDPQGVGQVREAASRPANEGGARA